MSVFLEKLSRNARSSPGLALTSLTTKRARALLLAIGFLLTVSILLITRPRILNRAGLLKPLKYSSPGTFKHRPAPNPPSEERKNTAECKGARGPLRNKSFTGDVPKPIHNLEDKNGRIDFPNTTYGSYEAVGLEKTWLSFDQRYGPYGYREEEEDYHFEKADWSSLNWGHQQDSCLLRGSSLIDGYESMQENARPRFRLVRDDHKINVPKTKTGRQAIVLRTWEGYDYTPEDLWNIRSIITEASLLTNGQFTVVLLVDVKREDGAGIHEDDGFYRQVVEETVPKEFWDIAVLFHKSLQESWYPKIGEYKPFWQIMQPLQLFAHFYPEFDHFWQIEMDTRFTGLVGKILQALHEFGKSQPYKQSYERASWTFIPRIHNSYQEFSAKINESLNGGATVWGPLPVSNDAMVPVGKTPAMKAIDDNFELGVGEDADLLTFTAVFDVLRFKTFDDWNFKDWHSGISGTDPRFGSVPAQARASRVLLEAIHNAQHNLNIKVHSEATLATFAFWNGLKVVGLPMPNFQFPERDVVELNWLYNGGSPTDFADGVANGVAPYKHTTVGFYARPRTWEWRSSLVNPTFERWMSWPQKKKRAVPDNQRGTQAPIPDVLPAFLREVDGTVYAPGFMMHPRKTNKTPG